MISEEHPWSVKNYIQNWRRTTNTMNTLLRWYWTAIQLATYPIQLFQQCKRRAYETPLYLCGHVECLLCLPHGHIIRGYPACIRDPAFIIKLCRDTVCIGGPEFIRGLCFIEEIQYLYQKHHTASLAQAQSFAKDHAFRCTLQWTWKMLYIPER